MSEVARSIVAKLCQIPINKWPRFIKFSQKFGRLLSQKWGSKNIKISVIWRLDREYLGKELRNRQTINGVANCDNSGTRTFNLMNFGLQMAKK